MTYPKFHLSCLASSVLLGLAGLCLVARATEAPVNTSLDPEKVRVAKRLVEALDADSYQLREKARQSLLRLGRPAIEPLEVAAHSPSSETRLRAVELLVALRGRGLLGITMMQFGQMPEYGAGVATVYPELPAEKAGLQGGDIIVEINGEPIDNNATLQNHVFAAGPARVMDVVAIRGDERMHFQVLLTLNLSVGLPEPPVKLERELPASEDPAAREQARQKALNLVFNQGFVQAVPDTIAPNPQPEAPVNVKELENEFDRLKAQVEKEQAEEKSANTAAK